MKNFRSQFTQTSKALLLALVFSGASLAFAADWTPPTANPPANNAPAPINISSDMQTKGGLLTFLNTNVNSPTLTVGVGQGSTAVGTLTAGLASWGKSWFIGDVTFGLPTGWSSTTHVNSYVPITVDLDGSGISGANGRNALNLVGSADNDSVGVIQNKPTFFLWDYSAPNGGDRASLQAKDGDFSGSISADNNGTIGNNLSIANNIRIGGGNPKPTTVLTAIDTQGNAQWSPVSSLLDIKYVTHVWGNLNSGNFGDMQCPQGYIAIAASCDCQGGLDACIIAQLNGQNDAVGLPDNSEISVNWGSSDPHPDWVTGNCRNNGDLHMQATCLRLADQGNNPEFSWKNIQAKDRKYCDNAASYWNGIGKGCTVAWDNPQVSSIVYIGGAGQSAKDWYLDKSNDGNQYAYALMNASPDAPSSTKWGPSGASFYSGWQAQYTGGLINTSQLGNFNTGVRHSNYRDQGTNAATGEVAGCLYTTRQSGEGRPAANRLNYNVDAMSQIAGDLYSGPCDDNPQNDNAGPGGQYPSTLYPVLTNDILFLKAQ